MEISTGINITLVKNSSLFIETKKKSDVFCGLIERIKLLNCTNKLNAVGYIYVPEPDVVLEMPDFFHTYSVVVYVAHKNDYFFLCHVLSSTIVYNFSCLTVVDNSVRSEYTVKNVVVILPDIAINSIIST